MNSSRSSQTTHSRSASLSTAMNRTRNESICSDGSHKRFSEPEGGDKSGWLKSVKNWLAVAEPSAQAMKEQKRATYKKHGVSMKDPQAAAKMHMPVGKLPKGTTTSTSGPTPEEVLVKERQMRSSYRKHNSAQSVSSGYSSGQSFKETNPVAPWAD